MIHYLPPGSTSSPSYTNLIPDFQYLDQNYFNNPDYLKVEKRLGPSLFIYLTRAYFTTAAGQSAVAKSAMTAASGDERHIRT